MAEFPFRWVDGLTLGEEYRAVLRPGELVRDRSRRLRRLPRFFYEIPSWDAAHDTDLTEHFKVWEFINADVREAELLRVAWPRYIPCAVAVLAAQLELFRRVVDTYVHIAANGGYRSPGHRLSTHASTHCWGTAVNVYRIGDDWLDDEKNIGRYSRIARELIPGIWTRPWGHGVGEADDHLHLDLGYTEAVPHDAPGEAAHDDDPLPKEDRDVAEAAEIGA
ncbi:MAG TPA: hypothetical protein VF615_18220 [Longimicrobiaceae bacterium]|jgi:hypothetical protein